MHVPPSGSRSRYIFEYEVSEPATPSALPRERRQSGGGRARLAPKQTCRGAETCGVVIALGLVPLWVMHCRPALQRVARCNIDRAGRLLPCWGRGRPQSLGREPQPPGIFLDPLHGRILCLSSEAPAVEMRTGRPASPLKPAAPVVASAQVAAPALRSRANWPYPRPSADAARAGCPSALLAAMPRLGPMAKKMGRTDHGQGHVSLKPCLCTERSRCPRRLRRLARQQFPVLANWLLSGSAPLGCLRLREATDGLARASNQEPLEQVLLGVGLSQPQP